MNDQVFDLASGQERINGWRSNVAPVPKIVVPIHLSSGYDFNKLNLPPDNRSTVPLDMEHRARINWVLRGGAVGKICYLLQVEPALVLER